MTASQTNHQVFRRHSITILKAVVRSQAWYYDINLADSNSCLSTRLASVKLETN